MLREIERMVRERGSGEEIGLDEAAAGPCKCVGRAWGLMQIGTSRDWRSRFRKAEAGPLSGHSQPMTRGAT